MMIRFTSKHSSSVSMFEKDAKDLLKLMDQSGSVPSALRPERIQLALDAMRHALNKANNKQGKANDADDAVSMNTRAYPLIELLKSAQEKQEHVMWDYDNSPF